MMYFKDVLRRVEVTGNFNGINIADVYDIDTESTKVLESFDIKTLSELMEIELDELDKIPRLRLTKILEFFQRISELTYYSDGVYKLNTKGRNYLLKIS